MMKKHAHFLKLLLLFLLLSLSVKAHEGCVYYEDFPSGDAPDIAELPTEYFGDPLKIPLVLAGTFGELRSNHFHAGVDIKTQGKSGLNVYSAAEGYVSRIKVSPYGYGKALYIDHPNGYTTVYGHLSEYNEAIGKYIKDLQYEYESFEVDVEVPPNTLMVKKGEIVAKSGNTGGSSAPHLHYEIRHTKTEFPFNPLLFGLKIKDTRKPIMQNLRVYGIDDAQHVLPQSHQHKCTLVDKKYKIAKDTIKVNANRIGLSLNIYDRQDGANNKNGIYTLEMKVDSVVVYNFDMTRFSFYETRYLNAHVDYKERIENRSWYNKCFIEPANHLSNYPQKEDRGIIDVGDGLCHWVELTATDVAGNESVLSFYVQKDATGLNFGDLPSFTRLLDYGLPHELVENDKSLMVNFPPDAFYNDVFFNHQVKATSKTPYSSTYILHTPNEPLHKPMQLSIKAENLSEPLWEKAVIVREVKDKKQALLTNEVVAPYIKASSKSFGTFYIEVDTLSPTIKPVYTYKDKNLQKYNLLRFKIHDDLAGIQAYEGRIDEQWVLMDYDAKNNLLIHYFEKNLKKGKHHFSLRVSDYCGNVETYEFDFVK